MLIASSWIQRSAAIVIALEMALLTAPTAVAQSLAQIQSQARKPSNEDLVELMFKRFLSLHKLFEPIPWAIVWNEPDKDLDLTKWPGTLVAEAVARQERRCGMTFRQVSIRDPYELAILLSQKEVLNEGAAWERSAERLRRIFGDEVDRTMLFKGSEVIDGFSQGPTMVRVFVSFRGPHDETARLPPMGFLKLMFGSFNRHLSELEALRDQSDRFEASKEQLIDYLESIIGICPRSLWNWKLKLMGFPEDDEIADLLERVMRDDRIQPGMMAPEVAVMARQILSELRPGR